MMALLILLGGLGLTLNASAVVGLVLEVLHRKPHRWQLMGVSGVVFLAGLFVSPPPAAWLALTHGPDIGTSLRAGALGVFLAALCLAYINACRRVDELCRQVKEMGGTL